MKILKIVALSLALTTPANAFMNPQHSGTEDIPEWLYLTCKPPLDHKDKDPVIKIEVTTHFDEKDRNVIISMDAIHTRYSGATVNRSEQYIQSYLGQYKPGLASYSWDGVLRTHQDTKMVGWMHKVAGTWHYSEEIFKELNNNKDWHKSHKSMYFMDSICEEPEGD